VGFFFYKKTSIVGEMESSSSSSHQEGPLVILALLVGSLEMSLVFGLQVSWAIAVSIPT